MALFQDQPKATTGHLVTGATGEVAARARRDAMDATGDWLVVPRAFSPPKLTPRPVRGTRKMIACRISSEAPHLITGEKASAAKP